MNRTGKGKELVIMSKKTISDMENIKRAERGHRQTQRLIIK